MIHCFFLFLLLKSIHPQYQSPDSYLVFSPYGRLSMGGLIIDSAFTPNFSFFFTATKNNSVRVTPLTKLYVPDRFLPPYSIQTFAEPILVRSLGNEYLVACSQSPLNGTQYLEIFEIHQKNARLEAKIELADSSIQELIGSQDGNQIYGLDMNSGLFIIDSSNKSEINWFYRNSSQESVLNGQKYTHMSLSSNGSVIFFSTLEFLMIARVLDPGKVTYIKLEMLNWLGIINKNSLIVSIITSQEGVLTLGVCQSQRNLLLVTFLESDSNQIWKGENLEDSSFDECSSEIAYKLKNFQYHDFCEYIFSGAKNTEIIKTSNFGFLPVIKLDTLYSDFHFLPGNLILLEQKRKGIYSIFSVEKIERPRTILEVFEYSNSLKDQIQLSLASVVAMNPNTLYFGWGNTSNASTLIGGQLLNVSINFTKDLEYYDFYMDLNNLSLSFGQIFDSRHIYILTSLVESSGSYLITYAVSKISGSSDYEICIYNATQNFDFVLLKNFSLGFSESFSGKGLALAQVGSIIYWFSNLNDPQIFSLQGFDLSSLSQAQIKSTNIEILLNVSSSAMSGCQQGLGSYLFYKTDQEPFIYVLIASRESFWKLSVFGWIYVGEDITVMQTTESCDALYTGGDSFRVFNISDPAQITQSSSFDISTIITITQADFGLLYVNSKTEIYIFDNSESLNLKLLTKAEMGKSEMRSAGYLVDPKDYKSIYAFRSEIVDQSVSQIETLKIIKVGAPPMFLILSLAPSPDLFVGITSNYPYFHAYVDFQGDLIKLDHGNSLKCTASMLDENFKRNPFFPSWLNVDFGERKITVTPPKDHEGRNITLLFECLFDDVKYNSLTKNYDHLIHQYNQTLYLPRVFSTLFIDYSSGKLIISSPSQGNLILMILFNPVDFYIIVDNFNGIFVEYLAEIGLFTAHGSLDPMNNMLKNLRYACKDNQNFCENNSFNLTVSDLINNNKTLSYISISVLKKNNFPIIMNRLQDQIDNYFGNKAITPNRKFNIFFPSNSFVDQDQDALSYSVILPNGSKLPAWLHFDPIKLELYGEASLVEEGTLSLIMNSTDGYNFVLDYFSLTVFDYPPIINISIASQFSQKYLNQTVFVGQSLDFFISPFEDLDGPDQLIYSAEAIYKNGTSCPLTIDSSCSWIKFRNDKLQFNGIPSKEDVNASFNIIVQANDGLKFSQDSFSISVQKSLYLIINQKSLPEVKSKFAPEDNLYVSIRSQASKIILPKKDQILISLDKFDTNSEMNQIEMEGTTEKINSALKSLIFRGNRKSNSRILSNETIPEILLIHVNDSLNQTESLNIPISFIKNGSQTIKIMPQYAQQKYTLEVGSEILIEINPNIFNQEAESLNLNYSLILTDRSGSRQDFLSCDQSLNLVSSAPLEDSNIGNYDAYLTSIDEFNDSSTFHFFIEVNYSHSALVQIYFRKFSPLIVILGLLLLIYLFYHPIYNFYFYESNEMIEEILLVNRPFKRKYAFIASEYYAALKASLHYFKVQKKGLGESSTTLCTVVTRKDDEVDEISKIMDLIPVESKVSRLEVETLECICEGFLISMLIEKIPYAVRLFKIIERMTEIKRQKTFGKKARKHWFEEFFISDHSLFQRVLDDSKNENCVLNKLGKYVRQSGKFKIVEKHCVLNETLFKKMYDLSLLKLEHNAKKEKIYVHPNMYELMLKSLIMYKRGIYRKHSIFSVFFYRIFSQIHLIAHPFVYGHSISANDYDFRDIKSKWSYSVVEAKSQKVIEPKMKTKFFSSSNRYLPSWMKAEIKHGIFVIKGIPPEGEEGKLCRIYAEGPQKKLLFHLRMNFFQSGESLDQRPKKSIKMSDIAKPTLSVTSFKLGQGDITFKKGFSMKESKTTSPILTAPFPIFSNEKSLSEREENETEGVLIEEGRKANAVKIFQEKGSHLNEEKKD